MIRYEICLTDTDACNLLLDAISMNPFPIIRREQAWDRTSLTLTLTEEEYVFLSLKYKMITSHEITAVDVVGAIINA